MNFLEELKRRHVYRVAAAYAVVGWLLIQVATQVFPVFHLPDWIDQAVVLLILIGFPIALMLAWAFDATLQGIVATDAQDAGANPRMRRRSRRAGATVGAIGVLIALTAGGAYWQFGRVAPTTRGEGARRSPENATPDSAVVAAASPPQTTSVGAPAVPIPQKSVAVLPLSNESGEKDQQYFSDGLSEDLINALSQFAGLKVISRNSSFQFRDSKQSSAAIGHALGVAHLLEGSVQKLGDEVRISAELVNAADGSTLWSQHYDRPYKDLFALQDDITKAVADALKAKLLDNGGAVPQSDRPPSGNLDAWNAYSRGRFYDAMINPDDERRAIGFYEQAIALDPHYAQAYASLSLTWTRLAGTFLSGEAQRQAFAKARTAAEQALQLDPDVAIAHDARGLLLQWVDFDWNGAEAEYRRALELAPADSTPRSIVGRSLAGLGQAQQAIPMLRQAIATDPRNGGTWGWLGWTLAAAGRLDEAQQAARKAHEFVPGSPFVSTGLVIIQIQRGENKAALTAAQQIPGVWGAIALALASQGGGDRAAADAALKNLIAKQADGAAYQIAEVYGLRRDPDNMFKWLDRAWDTRDSGIGRLLTDPFIVRYKDDPRFAAFCKKVGLPTSTDAKAMP